MKKILLEMKDMERFTLNQLNINSIQVTSTATDLFTFGKHSLGFCPASLTEPRLIFIKFLKLS